MSTILFIYGTLAPGEENEHIMDGMNGKWRKAAVRGNLHNIGWGAHKGHPGFTPDEEGEVVNGLVFTSNDLPANWSRLDTFEGTDYKRIPVKATLENGDTIVVQIYSVV